VLVTFLGLAGALIALQARARRSGWGFQLQSPGGGGGAQPADAAIALNLSGVFEVAAGSRTSAPAGAGGAGRHGRLPDRRAGGGGGGAVHRAVHGGGAGLGADSAAAVSLLVFAALRIGFAAPFTR
jgi:thiol:disulfide interchange protein DsbD